MVPLRSVLLFGCLAGAYADQAKAQHPDLSAEAFVVTNIQTKVRFQADGSSERVQTTSVKVVSQAGVQTWGVLGADYAADNEHVDVHFVRVHKADGSTVETPMSNVQDLPAKVTSTAPIYSDLKQKQIPVKALGQATRWNTSLRLFRTNRWFQASSGSDSISPAARSS